MPKGKKRSNSDKKHEVKLVDLIEQKPLILVTLEEFFQREFFRKVSVNMVLCFELEDEDDE